MSTLYVCLNCGHTVRKVNDDGECTRCVNLHKEVVLTPEEMEIHHELDKMAEEINDDSDELD